MPRNAQGIYTLPAGNPVVPGTLIETTWANPTMSDIAAALTGSLPRNGSASMTGPLILNGDATLPLEAVPLQQLNATVGGTNSFLPAGAVQLFAMAAVPAGWLECNGSAISRTTYANLFAAIGTLYGVGNGTTTFNLPDLRGEFVRGWDNGRSADPGRAMGSNQTAANNPHTHVPTVSNPAHAHTVSDPGHNHTLTDPTHAHTFGVGIVSGPAAGGTAETPVGSGVTDPAATGISIAPAGTGLSVAAAAQATSVSIAAEGIEARPRNVAMVYAIKAFGALQTDGLGSMAFQNKEAVNITGGIGAFTKLSCADAPVNPTDVARLADIGGSVAGILSADPQVLLVDNTTPSTPILRPQTNVPNGTVKLDAAGFVPSSILNITDLTFLGTWDALPGVLPTGTFVTGDYYIIDVSGTLTLETSSGSQAIPCNVGDSIIYKTTPVAGWWYAPAPVASALPATAISFAPSGTIVATNVQAAIAELDGETQTALGDKVALSGGVMTGPLTTTALTSNGQVESKVTGFKFPDATVQAGAAYTKAQSDAAFVSNTQVAQKPIFVGTFAGSGIGSGSTTLTLVSEVNVGVTQVGGNLTPTKAGWYQCNMRALMNVVGATAIGVGIGYSTGGSISQQVQPPYSTAFGFCSVSDLIYCNGTTDFVTFSVTTDAAGGNVSNARGSLVWVHP